MSDQTTPHTIFVSHAHADNALCDRYVEALRARGLAVWYDRTNMQGGRLLSTEIEKQLERSSAFVLMLTPASINLYWVQLERSAYHGLISKDPSRVMIPVRISECGVPALLNGIDWIDALNLGFEATVNAIAIAIGAKPDTSSSLATIAQQAEPESTLSMNNSQRPSTESPDIETARWLHDALDFFEGRLSETFPGVRGLRIYSGPAAFDKLVLLLREPITLPVHAKAAPLWWWRGLRNLWIDCFRALDEDRLLCLMDDEELLIDSVAVHRSTTRPYRSFVYVSTRADKPVEVRPRSPEQIEADVREWGYSYEAVAYWNNRYISREEYDDGHIEIEDRVMKLKDAELRYRYLTPYNFFIASQASVLNSSEFDSTMDDMCRDLIQGVIQIEDVVRIVETRKLTGRVDFRYHLLD